MHGRNQDLLKKFLFKNYMFNKANFDLGIMWYFDFWVEEKQ